jgi:hypothetical protein
MDVPAAGPMSSYPTEGMYHLPTGGREGACLLLSATAAGSDRISLAQDEVGHPVR